MRKPIKFALALLLVGALVCSALLVFRPGEPRYRGQPVSFWFKQYYRSGSQASFDSELHEEAAVALQKMGTNAVPFLLKEALSTEADSPLRQKLSRICKRLPSWCPKFWSHDTMRWEALQAVHQIKPPAGLVLPQLEKPLAQTNTVAQWNAIFLLGCIGEGGEQGVPLLLQALDGPKSRVMVVQSLGLLGPRASAAVPQLVELLQAGDNHSNHWDSGIVHALGSIGSNAAPALPMIQKFFLAETNHIRRATLAMALCQIDARQDEPLAFLIRILTDSSSAKDQRFAAMFLGQVGPNAKAAVPALLATLDSPKVENCLLAVEALKKIGVPQEVLVAKLEENLPSNDETVRVNSAARILTIEPGNAKAQQALLRLIQGGSMFSTFAVESLGRAGAPARAVVPALRQVMPSASKELREKTQRAIRRIESDVP